MENIRTLLRQRFIAQASHDLDATIELNWPDGSVVLSIARAQLVLHDPERPSPSVDLVIYFSDEALAVAILSGLKSPIKAFLAGDFRSSGYIVWVFQTLSVFTNPRKHSRKQ